MSKISESPQHKEREPKYPPYIPAPEAEIPDNPPTEEVQSPTEDFKEQSETLSAPEPEKPKIKRKTAPKRK